MFRLAGQFAPFATFDDAAIEMMRFLHEHFAFPMWMIAPDVAAEPAYAQAPVVKQNGIAAYIGVPLLKPGGELFGTICAIDRAPASHDIVKDEPIVRMCARMLSSYLAFAK